MYCPAVDKKETEKTFMGPIYTGIETKSNYHPQAEEKPHADGGLMGPKYDVDSTSNYYPHDERAPAEHPMVGPIYPNVETCNKYNLSV